MDGEFESADLATDAPHPLGSCVVGERLARSAENDGEAHPRQACKVRAEAIRQGNGQARGGLALAHRYPSGCDVVPAHPKDVADPLASADCQFLNRPLCWWRSSCERLDHRLRPRLVQRIALALHSRHTLGGIVVHPAEADRCLAEDGQQLANVVCEPDPTGVRLNGADHVRSLHILGTQAPDLCDDPFKDGVVIPARPSCQPRPCWAGAVKPDELAEGPSALVRWQLATLCCSQRQRERCL